MGFINIFVGNDEFIKVKNAQLVFENGNASFPVEDINCLLIDNLKTTLSTYTINTLLKSGATIILCDEKHLPTNLIVPNQGYYQRLKTLNAQTTISKPKIKRLWQEIISSKIKNQATTLQLIGDSEGAEYLFTLSNSVLSNDSDNKEAVAAHYYFTRLFDSDFARTDDFDIRNGGLNYVYSIVRSLIARHLCARGFECAFGIFHHSTLNAFNLVDDILEPFRPICDLFVKSVLKDKNDDILTPNIKKELFSILNIQVKMGDSVYSLSYSVEMFCESLHKLFLGECDFENITFPLPIEIQQQRYI